MNEPRKVSLIGDHISLDILEKIFKSEDIYIYSEEHINQKVFFMKSIFFENLDENELRRIGNDQLKKVNSICSFVKNNFIPVKMEDVYIGDCAYNDFEDHITIRDDLNIVENGIKKDLDEGIILEIYSKIKNDTLLNDILLLLFDKGADWVNLYRIIEHFDKNVLISRKWITKDDLKLIKHTANSPGAVGNEARHGSSSNQPPLKPMPLNMARTLVNNIIWQYIKSL